MAMKDEDREILLEFIREANEGLEKAEALLLRLEEQTGAVVSSDRSLIDSLFRVFHSLKGNAGFLGLSLVNTLTHQAESLLDSVRKGRMSLGKSEIDLFFEVCDALQMILEYVEEHGEERGFQNDFRDLKNRLKQLIGEEGPALRAGSNTSDGKQDPAPHILPGEHEVLVTDSMKKEFAQESRELLEQLEQDLLVLEKEPDNFAILNRIFRALHTIKGNAGFLGFGDIHEICHKAETIFDAARSGTVVLQERQISLMLQIIDFIGAALDAIKQGDVPVIAGKNALLDLMADLVTLPPDESHKERVRPISGAPAQNKSKARPPADIPGIERRSSTRLSDVIRVDVRKLNRLMDLVGEIVIAESTLLNHYSFQHNQTDAFLKALVYLQKNIRALQDLATSMRMVPLSGVFTKMHRLVRDIAAQKGKETELIINGGETEVDRSVIEHISDPLIHILRNALDHGIETPEERQKKGKARKGRIEIDVERVGGQIWIKVRDDGQGLNKEKILQRAWERGLIAQGQVPPDEQTIYNLIFEPGFSTADKITNISGRGVGMDVVRKNIEKIRGSISLTTVPQAGTTIIMKIPLTTAIIDGMLIRAGRSLYAIPVLDIREAVQVGAHRPIELIDGQEMINVRDRLIPVMRLEQLHASKACAPSDGRGMVVISEMAGKAVGFWVDDILGEQQLVLKPLPPYLGNLEGVSGCAVLGNGAICYILDLGALLHSIQTRVYKGQKQTLTMEA